MVVNARSRNLDKKSLRLGFWTTFLVACCKCQNGGLFAEHACLDGDALCRARRTDRSPFLPKSDRPPFRRKARKPRLPFRFATTPSSGSARPGMESAASFAFSNGTTPPAGQRDRSPDPFKTKVVGTEPGFLNFACRREPPPEVVASREVARLIGLRRMTFAFSNNDAVLFAVAMKV